MNNKIKSTICLLIVLTLPSVSIAGVSLQGDWSGGPGVPGPSVWYWYNTFSSQSHMSWTALPGKLLFGISAVSHPVNSVWGGCLYAFPADMDGDDDMDILAQSVYNWDVGWFENDGSGGGWDTHWVSENYPQIWCAYPGDLDADGDMDVVGANTATSLIGVQWWRNEDGVGDSWTRFYVEDQYGPPLFTCCADIDGDDTLEVVAPSTYSPNEIAWWESSTEPPDSMWEKHVVSSSSQQGWELFPIDLDQDGDMDILCGCGWSDGLSFWENTDSVGLSWTGHSIGNEQNVRSVHAADIDGDGDYDVVCCAMDDLKVSWFENLDDTCGTWEEHVIDTGYEWFHGVHAADVTDDGYVDIIVAVYEDDQLLLYRNVDGTGSAWAKFLLNSYCWFTDVDVADFNDDGHTDILAAASDGVEVSWHELSGYSSGWLESSILDVTGYPSWDSISWNGEEPAGTDIFFQVRGSNDWENMGAWCDTLFEPCSLEGYIDSTYRYIQYRVGMTSDNSFSTPVLDIVYFYWSDLGIEGSEGIEELSIIAVPNPSGSGVSLEVPSFYAGEVELLVYDLSGKLLSRITELDGSTYSWDCRDASGQEVPSGTYIIRAAYGERSATARFVKL